MTRKKLLWVLFFVALFVGGAWVLATHGPVPTWERSDGNLLWMMAGGCMCGWSLGGLLSLLQEARRS